MKNRIKINGTIIFLCIALIIIFKSIFLRASDIGFLEILGVSLLLLGQLIRISSRGYKAEYSRGGHELIKDGPYSLVRNPMYLGILLMGAGIVLFLFKFWVFFAFLAFFTIRYLTLIKQEEKILIEKFDREYEDYKKNTPRIFPRMNYIISHNIKNYLPLKLIWVKKEISSFVPIVISLVGLKIYALT
ncbi:MAG: isoprenylcysteine carboxylmethyltransferase family protein [Candidatus Omnitrophota bacterium]